MARHAQGTTHLTALLARLDSFERTSAPPSRPDQS